MTKLIKVFEMMGRIGRFIGCHKDWEKPSDSSVGLNKHHRTQTLGGNRKELLKAMQSHFDSCILRGLLRYSHNLFFVLTELQMINL